MESNSNSKKSGFKWLVGGPLALASLMFSTYVGPGFASGTQTTSYFLTKGWIGVFIGPIVVGIITFLWTVLANEFNRLYRPGNFREQSDMLYRNPVLKQIMGLFTDVLGIIQIVMVSAVMISGAANLLHNTLGISMTLGTIIFSAAILILTLSGTNLVLKAGTFLTLCILGVTIYIGGVGIGPAWPLTSSWLAQKLSPQEFGFTTFGAWYVIITFTNQFLSGRNSAVAASLDAIKSKEDSIVAAAGNALLCTLSTIVYTVIFAAGMPEITKEAIPTLYALNHIIGASTGAQAVYVVIALAAMLSTGVSLVYGGISRFIGPVTKLMPNQGDVTRRAVIAVMSILVSVGLSTFGILALIGVGYTYMGMLQFPLLVLLWFFMIPYRIRTDRKNGTLPAEN